MGEFSLQTVRSFRVDAVLFDLDGVMVYSTASIERAWRWWASSHGRSWSDVRPHVHGRLATDTIRTVLPDMPATQVEDEAQKVNSRQVFDTSDIEPVKGMTELVAQLSQARWAVVTACPPELAAARLVAGGYPMPEVLVTRNDVSRGKPDPQGYQIAADKLGIDYGRCLVIEDSPAGVAAGRAAGMPVIGLGTTHDPAVLEKADTLVRDGRTLSVERSSTGDLSVLQYATVVDPAEV